MLSVRCLSVCHVCPVCLSGLVYCGQTVGQIKLKLGMQVGLGPGHIVLGGDAATPPQRGIAPNFRPISVAAKWLHGSRCHSAWSEASAQATLCRWGPRSPPQKGGGAPKFSAHVYCDQTARWIKMVLGMEIGLSQGDFVLDGDPPPPSQKGGGATIFWPMSIVAKRLKGSKRCLEWR